MVEISPSVNRRLRQLGNVGQQWLDGLDSVVCELESLWSCRVEESLGGGSAAFVATAIDRWGRPAVLKVAIPAGGEGYADFEREALALSLGCAENYVEVYEVDELRRTLLLERLGPSLADLRLSVEAQIDIIVATLRGSWRPVAGASPLLTGADQARWLGEFIQQQWIALDHPCRTETVGRALEYVERRLAAFDRSTAVLIHGDAHPGNMLAEMTPAGDGGRFKLIDPEGLISEPAHELGIPLRSWCDEMAGDAVRLGTEWCHRLSAATGVDGQSIWEWAFIERVSTGLLFAHLGDTAAAGNFLDIADQWSSVSGL
jgi:streptomycin 6-kinase